MHSTEITYIYPVPGHSYLPVDKCFDRVEKDLAKHETILSPGDYESVLSQHNTIHLIGNLWSQQKDFKILSLHRRCCWFENNVQWCRMPPHVVKERTGNLSADSPSRACNTNKISAEKKKDVLHLLAFHAWRGSSC
jgi:hypothetical protein